MKQSLKKWLRPGLFTLGGAFAGLGYYFFVGCASGSCPITSDPISSTAYMGVIGWLMSGVFGKECGNGCNWSRCGAVKGLDAAEEFALKNDRSFLRH